MPEIEVVPITTRNQKKAFLKLPMRLHSKDPNFVPRIRASESELAGFNHHPFYDNAESQAFIVQRDGVGLGRIVAIDNQVHRERFPDDDAGFVGFFECTNDTRIAQSLFECASQWLAERGLTKIKGPINPSMNYEAGLLVDGFDKPSTFMLPYNPSYYESLWTQSGFTKTQDMFAFLGNRSIYDAADKAWRIAEQAQERFGAEFRQIAKKNFVADVQLFLEIYNAASAGTWGFVPFSSREIACLANELKYLIVPELTSFMIVDGKTIGATFGLLDYNPIVKKISGRIFPFGFLSLLLGRKNLSKSRCMSINVLPEYQRWGLGLCLLNQFLKQSSGFGIKDVEFSYVLESNMLAATTLTKAGVVKDKVFRVYEKMI